MRNKHKLWIVGVIFLFAVAIVGFASTQVPSLVITDPNSTLNSSSSVSHSTSTGKINRTQNTQNQQQTTPQTTMKSCPICTGTGKLECPVCYGKGYYYKCNKCGYINYHEGPCPNRNDPNIKCTGWVTKIACPGACHGSGKYNCYSCKGDGILDPGDPGYGKF